jgi:SAM-dependent methyltransferase
VSGFDRRSRAPERIDDPALPAADMAAAMADLARVNRLLRAFAPTFAFLRRATRDGRPFTLLDVGCGHGDLLRAVAVWARRRGIEARLTGLDRSAAAVAAARAATPRDLGVTYLTGDVFDHRPDPPPDLITASLFLHHLSDGDVARYLRWAEATAGRGWHVNDLHRHPLARAGFRALSAVAGWHPIVRHDGAVSVMRGFSRAELAGALSAAGVSGATVRWRPMFRWAVDRLR